MDVGAQCIIKESVRSHRISFIHTTNMVFVLSFLWFGSRATREKS